MCLVGGVFLLQRIIFDKSDVIKIICKILIIFLLCFVTTAVLFCTAAAIIANVNFSYDILPAVTASILAFSAFADGFLISRWNKENGMIWGISAGIIITVILVAVSVKCGMISLSGQLIVKSLINMSAGAIGGIIGVNTN